MNNIIETILWAAEPAFTGSLTVISFLGTVAFVLSAAAVVVWIIITIMCSIFGKSNPTKKEKEITMSRTISLSYKRTPAGETHRDNLIKDLEAMGLKVTKAGTSGDTKNLQIKLEV